MFWLSPLAIHNRGWRCWSAFIQSYETQIRTPHTQHGHWHADTANNLRKSHNSVELYVSVTDMTCLIRGVSVFHSSEGIFTSLNRKINIF